MMICNTQPLAGRPLLAPPEGACARPRGIVEPRFYSGGGGSSTPPRNLYDETRGELQAKLDLQPAILGAEAAYRPQYNALDLQGIEQYLKGIPGGKRTINYSDLETVPAVYRDILPGDPNYREPRFGQGDPNRGQILVSPETQRQVLRSREVDQPAQRGYLDIFSQDIQPAADSMTARSLSTQRGADIADVETLGPRATAAFKAANPQQQALLDELNRQSLEELKMGAHLDPGLAREVQQSVRAGQSARGFGYGRSDVNEEATFTAMQADELRRRRQAQGMAMAGMNSATTIDPFLSVLGRQGTAQNQANIFSSQGSKANATAGPQLFGSSINANDIYDSNFNAANANEISNRNNQAAMNSAYISGGAAIAGTTLAIAL